jgi:hypothetical protein
MNLPLPVLEEHEGIRVVREDLIPGGSKARAISVFFDGAEEYVYASPVYGYAQIALAHAARRHGKKALIFCAQRGTKHACTLEAYNAGANVFQVECGYMSVVRARAKLYCQDNPRAKLLPFGLDDPLFIAALAGVAATIAKQPSEVWCAAGSGVLARALGKAWPDARINAVMVGATPDVGRARLFAAPEKFEQDARRKPPFPSCSNYDAKVWRFVKQHAEPGALFWNL